MAPDKHEHFRKKKIHFELNIYPSAVQQIMNHSFNYFFYPVELGTDKNTSYA